MPQSRDNTAAFIAAARTALKDGLAQGALLIEGRAKELVPVKTGNLRRSLMTEVQATPNGATARVGTGVDYAPYVEFGTRRQRAQPYLRPAFDSQKDAAIDTAFAHVRRVLGLR